MPLAQASGTEGAAWLERLGTAGIVAALTIWWALTERKERLAAQAHIADLNKDAVDRERRFNDLERQTAERERERSERQALILHDAAETLRDVRAGMFAAVEKVTAPQDRALDVTMRRLELIIDDLKDERAARPPIPEPPTEGAT